MRDNKISLICVGGEHSLIYRQNGDLLACGRSFEGQLGGSQEKNRFFLVKNIPNLRQISCGAYHTVLLDGRGQVMVSGSNKYGKFESFFSLIGSLKLSVIVDQ